MCEQMLRSLPYLRVGIVVHLMTEVLMLVQHFLTEGPEARLRFLSLIDTHEIEIRGVM